MATCPTVLEYLDAVERDIKENVDDFLPQPPRRRSRRPPAAARHEPRRSRTRGFAAIRSTSSSTMAGSSGAPVVYEDNPTHQTLVGRVEHLARFGALVTDFNLLIAGRAAPRQWRLSGARCAEAADPAISAGPR